LSLATGSSGILIGGSFTQTGSSTAIWNGTSISSLGESLNVGADVYSIISGSNQIFVGGLFNNPVNRKRQMTVRSHQNDIGLWSGYGETPKSGQGIIFGIAETYQEQNDLTGSLIELCGFTAGEKDIGVVSDENIISEAVVMIPYVLRGDENLEDNSEAKNTLVIEGEQHNLNISSKEGPFYFSVDKNVINNLLDLEFEKTNADQIIKKIELSSVKDSSITKTIGLMGKYNIPPHLDWVNNKNIDPFVMYIFEFKNTLDTQDLSDIWQGVMPKIAKNPEVESNFIEHSLDEKEFFHGKSLPENIRFKIFKVKKKAKKSYYELTDDSKDDNRFKFKFDNQEKTPDYSYNYPYDFFSLVEMINVEVGSQVSEQPVEVKKNKTIPKIKSTQKKINMNNPVQLEEKLYPISPPITNVLALGLPNSFSNTNKKLFEIKTATSGIYDTTVSLGQNISVGSIIATSKTGAKIKSPVAGKVSYINDKVGNEGRINASVIIFKIEV
jgi:hypothetical protein